MAKFTLELCLDGYDSEEEMIEACKIFIYDQLNFTGSGVSCIEHIPDLPDPVDDRNFLVQHLCPKDPEKW